MRLIYTALFALVASVTFAQPTVSGLIAYYNFDNGECKPYDATGNGSNAGILQNEPSQCACGVLNTAINFTEGNNWYTVAGSVVLDLFDTEDFTVSMYFKVPNSDDAVEQVLMSKKSDDCSITNSFEITYSPNSRFVDVLLQQNDNVGGSISAFIDGEACWQWITIVREGLKTLLYINGELKSEVTASERVNLQNDNVLTIGKAHCSERHNNFKGVFDEIRLYNRALSKSEVKGLDMYPDRIATASLSRDTLIFKGSTVPVRLSNTCATEFTWTPADQVCEGCTEVTDATPDLAPQTTTTFTVSMQDTLGCIAQDTLRVTVIDPDSLDCSVAYLPKAFTPNFDGLNDTYGIDNSLVLDDIVSFEIFDKWGERVFYTTEAEERWDGSFNGTEMTAGIYIYKVVYLCDGNEKTTIDSFTVIR